MHGGADVEVGPAQPAVLCAERSPQTWGDVVTWRRRPSCLRCAPQSQLEVPEELGRGLTCGPWCVELGQHWCGGGSTQEKLQACGGRHGRGRGELGPGTCWPDLLPHTSAASAQPCRPALLRASWASVAGRAARYPSGSLPQGGPSGSGGLDGWRWAPAPAAYPPLARLRLAHEGTEGPSQSQSQSRVGLRVSPCATSLGDSHCATLWSSARQQGPGGS